VARNGVYKVLLGTTWGPRRKCQDNIRIDLKVICWEDLDSTDVSHDSDSWRTFCESGNEPAGSLKCENFLTT
jgi:hypothetical protein